MIRLARRARHHRAKRDAVDEAHHARITLEVQVVERDDASAGVGERQRMLEVRELRSGPAKKAWQRDGHPHLLEARGQDDRLDAVRHELGMARYCGEVEVGRSRRKLAQQVDDVRLLPGPAAPEDIGVDQDHAIASSYTAIVACETSAQLATRRGVGATAREIASLIADTSVGSTRTASSPASSAIGDPAVVTMGHPHASASATGMPKPS